MTDATYPLYPDGTASRVRQMPLDVGTAVQDSLGRFLRLLPRAQVARYQRRRRTKKRGATVPSQETDAASWASHRMVIGRSAIVTVVHYGCLT